MVILACTNLVVVISFMVGLLFDIKLLLFHLAFFQSMLELIYFTIMV